MAEKLNRVIKDWPSDDNPTERLYKYGEHTLSDSELIAVIIRSGTKDEDALRLSRRIISRFKTFRNMGHTDLSQWMGFRGLGRVKIAQIKAALEISRRFLSQERDNKGRISGSRDAAELFMPRMRDLKKEVFKILLLDSRNNIIDVVEITEGTVAHAHPIIREIISKAISHFASGLICVHNHPSGDPLSSKVDSDFTRDLYQAGRIMQVNIVDHIIIGDNTYYSFAESGVMRKK